MANSLNTNPIILDTFSSDVDIGQSLYGDSSHPFYVHSIEWQSPVTVSDTADVTDGKGTSIFHEVCTFSGQSIIKYLCLPVYGLKVPRAGVASGKIVIFLK